MTNRSTNTNVTEKLWNILLLFPCRLFAVAFWENYTLKIVFWQTFCDSKCLHNLISFVHSYLYSYSSWNLTSLVTHWLHACMYVINISVFLFICLWWGYLTWANVGVANGKFETARVAFFSARLQDRFAKKIETPKTLESALKTRLRDTWNSTKILWSPNFLKDHSPPLNVYYPTKKSKLQFF